MSLEFEEYISARRSGEAGGGKGGGFWASGIWLRSASMDVSGGKITREEIDRLAECEDKAILTVSGLNQETFSYLIRTYGKELRAVRFFKNKAVEDWSLLGELPELEYVYWFFNQRIDSLWDMSENRALKGLCLTDFSRLHKLEGIERAPSLEWFGLGNEVWDRAVADSYTCFAGTGVRHLEFDGKRITDGDLSFVCDMPKLEEFQFSPSLFPTEKIAWVMANRPDVSGRALKPLVESVLYNADTGEYNLPALSLPGKGKRCFPASDLEKKKRLGDAFAHLIEQYRETEYHQFF